MSSITNINNNSSVVNVGRTTPVSPGVQPSSRSIPVVVASDQTAIPVEEQNKVQSEVALSLLGIPRAEVALGIFADVNTYDVNPTEWSSSPATWTSGFGTRHIPAEAGALVEAPRNQNSVLTSKRFFRYQPGRVSAATFGIKSTVSQKDFAQNPVVRKYGIYDNFDGYYWETKQSGKGDNFAVVRRTQSLLKTPNSVFGLTDQLLRKPEGSSSIGAVSTAQIDDYRTVGTPPVAGAGAFESTTYIKQRNRIVDNRFDVALEALTSNIQAKCQRDVKYFMDAVGYDITLGTNYNATFQGLAEANSVGYPAQFDAGGTIDNAITGTQAAINNLSGVNPTAENRVDAFFATLRSIAIVEATRVEAVSDANQTRRIAALDNVTFTTPTGLTGSRVTAANTIVTERLNLAGDVNAFVATQTPETHNVNKCTRDVLFTLNAVAYDILYGGNSATWQAARFFMYNGFSQSDKTPDDGIDYIAQTVAAYNQLKILLDAELAAAGIPSGDERTKAGQLIDLIKIVIQNTNIDHLPPKVYPDTSWAAVDYTNAQAAITAAKQTIASSIAPITLDGDDEKCLRDVDFWIDMYLQDLAAGGDAHAAINTRNYSTALLEEPVNEVEMHFNVKVKLLELFTGENIDTTFYDRLQALTEITITFFRQVDPKNNPIAPTSYGAKSALETLFDARKYYWAYYVSEYLADGVTTVQYDSYEKGDRTFTAAEVKDKCKRDVVYVIDGYKDDLLGGGNFATKYNASMYYQGSGLSIGSQGGANDIEALRHTHLKSLIEAELTAFSGVIPSSTATRFNELSTLIINNFDIENVDIATSGNRGVAGNLVVYRDGLVMVHAAVYDPSLLKEKKRVRAVANASDNTIQIVEGSVTFGQRVKYFGEANGDLVDGKLYQVLSAIGPKGNKFTLLNQDGTNVAIANDDRSIRIQTVNPFIFPNAYNPDVYRANQDFIDQFGDATENADLDFFTPNTNYQGYDYRGMTFPYMYTSDGVLPLTNPAEQYAIGYIDTANPCQTYADVDRLKTEIDSVNFTPEYINFIRDNVKPEYWGVYEYRIPRSRFSTDKLNGKTNNLVYSDLAIGPQGRVLPGQTVIGDNGLGDTDTSIYDYDFTKVTMLKIEFSWYGAVGALFLAYVPVGNGEARWVRVHHLRASNQLKISSLGNATLPITYNVYGGGDGASLGDGEEVFGTDYGYGRNSHNLVKYGASYYIDGGDRGTVRLYSHTNGDPVNAYGRNYALGNVNVNAADDAINLPYIIIDDIARSNLGVASNIFFMSSRIKTANRIDQNIRIDWVDGNKLYLSANPVNDNIVLIPYRSNTVYGLETKETIISSLGQSVRNRVQVYPTKLSTANLGSTPVRMVMLKTPLFQTSVLPQTSSFTVTEEFEITGEVLPLQTTDENYLEDGDSIYGWFRVRVENDRSTAFGRLYREASDYYFELIEAFNGTVTILTGEFLRDERFDVSGTILTGSAKTTEEKEGLSSVVIADTSQVPIPRTGSAVATIYLQAGTEQIELNTYYDYNKEYLSYPLTDIAESLYFAVDLEGNPADSAGIGIGVTWEEQ